MKKIIFLFLIFLFCVSISEASTGVVAGISPSKVDLEIYRGDSKNATFGLSTNSEEILTFECISNSIYLTCPEEINITKGKITFLNTTLNIPRDYEHDKIETSFIVCKEFDMIRYCLQGKVNAEILEPESVFNLNHLIIISIFALFTFLIIFKNHLKKYFK